MAPFSPALLLKLFLYGYQEGIRSSHRLETEMRRNQEVKWLCQNALPSYKTIADFRKNNATAMEKVHREFLLLCRGMSLIGGRRVAIDGTYLKANANPNSFHTKATLERDLKRVEESIAAHYREFDEEDAKEAAREEEGAKDPDSGAKIKALLEKKEKKQTMQKQLRESGEKQISEVDTDARLLRKNGKTVGGYNGQITSDDKHKLIVVAHLVPNAAMISSSWSR